MIRCPDNQINASIIDISRIKWLVFLLWSSFFRTTTLYMYMYMYMYNVHVVPLQAPKHRPIISPRPVEQMAFRRGIKDNGL